MRYIISIYCIILFFGLNSCTKNKLDDVVLETHKYEEWSKLAPFDVTVVGGGNTAFISWTFKPEFLELLPANEVYRIRLYKGGQLRQTLPDDRVSFTDSTAGISYSYSLSIFYEDNHESPRTDPVWP